MYYIGKILLLQKSSGFIKLKYIKLQRVPQHALLAQAPQARLGSFHAPLPDDFVKVFKFNLQADIKGIEQLKLSRTSKLTLQQIKTNVSWV